MTRITILGGTGYAGAHLVQEAASRGHEVTAYSRTAPTQPVDGVTYVTGSVLDPAVQQQIVDGADVVISSLSPRGDMAGEVAPANLALASLAAAAGTRLIVVGGFGSLRAAPGAPRIATTDEFPADYRDEALELASVLESLQDAAPEGLDWTYASPSALFGAHSPGERTGQYVVDGEIATVFDSAISGQDFAAALIDEVETHERSGHIAVR